VAQQAAVHLRKAAAAADVRALMAAAAAELGGVPAAQPGGVPLAAAAAAAAGGYPPVQRTFPPLQPAAVVVARPEGSAPVNVTATVVESVTATATLVPGRKRKQPGGAAAGGAAAGGAAGAAGGVQLPAWMQDFAARFPQVNGRWITEWQDKGTRDSPVFHLDDTVCIKETWNHCPGAVGEQGKLVGIWRPRNREAVQLFVALDAVKERGADGFLTKKANDLVLSLMTGTNQKGGEWMQHLQLPQEEGGGGYERALLRCKVGHLTKDVYAGGAWSRPSISGMQEGTRVTLSSSWATLDQLVGKSGVVVGVRFVTDTGSKFLHKGMLLVLLDNGVDEAADLATQRLVDIHGLRDEWKQDPGLQWLPAAEELVMAQHPPAASGARRRPMLCLDSHLRNDDAAVFEAASALQFMRKGGAGGK
jgi:hypothetical protein